MQSKEGFHEFIAVSGFPFSFLLNEGTLFLKCYNTCSIAVLKYSRLITCRDFGTQEGQASCGAVPSMVASMPL